MKFSMFASLLMLLCTTNVSAKVRGHNNAEKPHRVLKGSSSSSSSSSSKSKKMTMKKKKECRDGTVGDVCSLYAPCCSDEKERVFCNFDALREEGLGTCDRDFPCGFENMFVFGDSTVDVGNGKQAFPCLNDGVVCPERYSDGPVLADFIAEEFGFSLTPSLSGGNNFAIASAVAGDCDPDPNKPNSCLAAQVDAYFDAFTPSKNDLILISMGGNDVRKAMTAVLGSQDPASAVPIITAMVTGIVTQVQKLVLAGACNIVVVGNPNVGIVPVITVLTGPAGAGLATTLSFEANQALQAALAGAKDSCGIAIKTYDAIAIISEILTSAPEFEDFNKVDACRNRYIGACDDPRFDKCFTGKNDNWGGAFCHCNVAIFNDISEECQLDDKYIFNDELHATPAANRFIAQKVLAEFDC